MHWGHAISRDMVSWIELPIALYPDELGTIFSGSAIVDYDNTTGFKQEGGRDPIVAIYTSDGDKQRQSIAYSLDGGFTYSKYEGNPVLEPGEIRDFRDPKVYWIVNKWVMVLAVFDRIEFFSSPDLKTWRKESTFGMEEGNHAGVWECPDLLQFDVTLDDGQVEELWVLVISVGLGGPNDGTGIHYMVGNLTTNPEGNLVFENYEWNSNQWIDYGPDDYAGVTFYNEPKDRKIFMGWVTNGMYSGDTPNLSHRGQMSLPRELNLIALNHAEREYRIVTNPVQELENLRDHTQHFEQKEVTVVMPQSRYYLSDDATFQNNLLELNITVEMDRNPVFDICAENNVNEVVCFGFDEGRWFVDRSNSGNVEFHENFRSHLRLHAPREGKNDVVNIRMFVDSSVLEVYADEGLVTMISLHFPTVPFDKLYMTNFNQVENLHVTNYDIYGLKCWFPENEN